MDDIQSIWEPQTYLWGLSQVNAAKVLRFRKYVEKFPELHHQTDVGHMASLFATLPTYFRKLREFGAVFNESFLYQAFSIHELGEFLLKQDITYLDKRDEHDLAEVEAVRTFLFDQLPPEQVRPYMDAFLLQFAYKSKDELAYFHQSTQEYIFEIKHAYLVEAYIFNMIERVDYVMYGLAHVHHAPETKSVHILMTHILRNQLPHLRQYAVDVTSTVCNQMPWLQVLWTDKQNEWAEQYLVAHEWVQDEREMFAKPVQ